VNTLVRGEDGALTGYNTDYDGFETLLHRLNYSPAGKKAVILGSGGSSVTVRAVLEDQHAKDIVIVSRTGENNYENLHLHRDASLIVNTTPVGMYPHTGVSPIALDAFDAPEAVVDIIYNPAKTRLLLDAEARGIPCINGLPMLVAQAKRASELFTGTPLDAEIVDYITACIAKKTRNILLIGMPSSGKSTVGAALANQTRRTFCDTDVMLEEQTGRTIPAIIAQDGLAAFRALESNVLAQAGMQSGTVIATGGGIVTIADNLPLIRQNSVCVFLNRDPARLSTKGRPLSQQYGVETLYRERLPLYRAWCDLEVDSNQSIPQAVQTIREALGL